MAGCASSEEKAAQEQQRVQDLTEALSTTIRYAVVGETKEASIAIQTPTGSRTEDIDVPMTSKAGNQYLEFTFPAGAFVYLSAQNKQGYGSVTCMITTGDGDVISENTASGGYAIATCKGTAR